MKLWVGVVMAVGGIAVGAFGVVAIYETSVVPKLKTESAYWFGYASDEAKVLTTCANAVTELNGSVLSLSNSHDESLSAANDFFTSGSLGAGDATYFLTRLYGADSDVKDQLNQLASSDSASTCLKGGPPVAIP